jgi:Mrp family chromosome partitioning ATPase
VFLTPRAGRVGQSVLFFSVDGPDHSASVCVRVATMLASLALHRVCLVDANLRSPSLHRTFGTDRQPGLVETFERQADGVVATREVRPHLWLLPSGRKVADPHAWITPERSAWLVAELGKTFEWVLIDAAPMPAAGDAMAFNRCVDGMIMVVAAHATRRAAALKVKNEVTATGGRLLGTVLTERTFPIPDPLYRRL